MRVPSNDSQADLGFNMTPMIDVVFLLIIFFLVSSHLAQQEILLDLNLPEATSGEAVEEADVPRVVVNVLADPPPDGQIRVGGGIVSAQELFDMIHYESGKSPGRLEIRIRCDRRVPYRLVEPIMIACAEAGVWNVTFAVTPANPF